MLITRGNLNYPSRLLDGAVRTRGGEFDVLQQDDRVIVHDTATAVASVLDPSTVTLLGDAVLPVAAGRLQFSIATPPTDGFTASISGGRLEVSASAYVERGAAADF